MALKKFNTAAEAAAYISPIALQWTLFFGDTCDRENLEYFAASLDIENPLSEEGCSYVADDNGNLGITVDNCTHVQWLATATELVPQEIVAETPAIAINGQLKDILKGLRNLFTLKGAAQKLLFTGAIMVVMWILTLLWQYLCIKNGKRPPFVAEFLAYLTFANGGVSTNIIYIIGGFVGKMFVMGTVFAFVLGGFKKLGKGVKTFVSATTRLNHLKSLGLYLAGMGTACVLYNFFVGVAVLAMTMAGVAGVLSMLWVLGGGENFIRRMTVALTATVDPRNKIHYEDIARAKQAISGIAVGFLLSIALSAVPWGFTPYVVGAVLLIAATVFLKAPSTVNRGTAARIAIALALATHPIGVSADTWYMELSKVENVANPHPLGSPSLAQCYEIATGEHTFTRDGEETVYTCTAPPKVIHENDSVKMVLSKYEEVIMSPYFDKDKKPNPAYGMLWNNESQAQFGKVKKSSVDPKSGLKEVYHHFYRRPVYPGDIKDGDEIAIYFRTNGGETRWIYKFKNVEEIPTEPVIIDEPEPEMEPTPEPAQAPIPTKIPKELILIFIIGILVSGGSGLLALLIALAENNNNDNPPDGPRPSDKYIERGEDGSFIKTNPITGESEYYPPGTDEEWAREEVERVLRNPNYYRRIYETQQKWTAEQRAEQKRKIDERIAEIKRNKEINDRLAKDKAKKDALIERLKEKYLVAFDDDPKEGENDDPNRTLRKYIKMSQNLAEKHYEENMKNAHQIELIYQTAKRTKDLCDISMDMAAAVTGPTGRMIRDIYKASTELTTSVTNAVIKDESIPKAVAAGVFRAGITYAQYNTNGVGKAFANVLGEGARDYVTAKEQGKSDEEAKKAFLTGMGRGAIYQQVDYATGKLGDAAHSMAESDIGKEIIKSDPVKQVMNKVANNDAVKKVMESDTMKKVMENETVKKAVNSDFFKKVGTEENVKNVIDELSNAADDIFKINADDYLSDE